MIVKMKKITLLLSANHRDEALKKLRKLGVLHIQNVQAPASEDIQSMETKLDNLNKAMQIIGPGNEKQEKISSIKAAEAVDKILALNQEMEGVQREMDENRELARWFQKWGAISFQSLQVLKEHGIYVRLYTTDKGGLKNIPDDKIIHIAREEAGVLYLAQFSESAEDTLDLKEVPVPQVELSKVETKIAELDSRMESIEKELQKYVKNTNSFVALGIDIEKRLELTRVKYGMGEVHQISYLQGFCPDDTVPEIEKNAEREGWGLVVQEPDDPSEVPTLTRNPKWMRMIEPLFNFMGTLPGYHEMDVSFVFLAFFTLFFAMLVGDGGYGLVFLILTFVFGRNAKGSGRDFVNLMYVLSLTTIIWGLITGNWFGSETIVKMPLLSRFVIPQLNTFSDLSTDVIMQLSFVIGVLQLSIGHLLAAFKKMNSLTALAEIGWIVVLWSVFFVANNLVLGKPMPGFTMTLLITGVAIIALFANFQKNIIKGILLTIGNLPLDIISSFSDIVSYIRLFAVGFASFIVASSFNTMAVGSGIDNIVSGIIAAIVLFLGHTLNIALCGMSVLVHGVRLNMLEFSGHVGVQWTGKQYMPFKE